MGGAAVVIVLSLAYLSMLPASSPGSSVRVFGLVSSMGAGTHPIGMVFTDSRSGQASSASVTGGGYSMQLPNHRVYNVTMNWQGNHTWQTGAAALGQLSVDMSEGSSLAQSYNVAQATPDSEVAVAGTLVWQMVMAQPTAIRFTASDGSAFMAPVAGLAFNATLPNLMTYEVDVRATNATGYSEWFNFHQLAVYAGVNTMGLTVRLGS
ncbi:MAG: hypothetical protein KGI26_05580 [Thaumarchaeota archaeon]|nr:hypothetical protein [Nitrososphaerota archaeon]